MVTYTPAQRQAMSGTWASGFKARPLCKWCKEFPVAARHSNCRYCSAQCRRQANAEARSQEAKQPSLALLPCTLACGRLRRSNRGGCLYCIECAAMLKTKQTALVKRTLAKQAASAPRGPVAPPQPPSRERALPVLASASRPVYVRDGSWTVNIAMHDVFFKERLFQLRQARNKCHPDAGGSHSKFLRAQARVDAFIAEETRYYAQYDLEVPCK